MVTVIVVVLVVVAVGIALVAYQRSDKTRHETQTEHLKRREGDELEARYQEEQRRRDELPPTHET